MKINWAHSAFLAAVASLPIAANAEEVPENKNDKPAAVATEEKLLTGDSGKADSPTLEQLFQRLNEQDRLIKELSGKIEELRGTQVKAAFLRNCKSAVAIRTNLKTVTQQNGTSQTYYVQQGSGIVAETNLGFIILTNVHNLLNGVAMEDFLKKSPQDQKTDLLNIARSSEVSVILPGGKEIKAKPLIFMKGNLEMPCMDAFRDLAFLIPSEDISSHTKAVNLSLELPDPGTPVMTLGNTLAGHSKIPLTTVGIVSAVGRYHPFSFENHGIDKPNNPDGFNFYTISNAEVLPGNSGGPLVGTNNDVCYGIVCHRIGEAFSKSLASREINEFGGEAGVIFSPSKYSPFSTVTRGRNERYNFLTPIVQEGKPVPVIFVNQNTDGITSMLEKAQKDLNSEFAKEVAMSPKMPMRPDWIDFTRKHNSTRFAEGYVLRDDFPMTEENIKFAMDNPNSKYAWIASNNNFPVTDDLRQFIGKDDIKDTIFAKALKQNPKY